MWLTGRLSPDFKTIADFRRDNGAAIRQVCRQFITLCRKLDLFSQSIIAIDGSKFKAVNSRDRNFTSGKLKARMAQVEGSIDRYLAAIETADRTQVDVAEDQTPRLAEKIAKLKAQMQDLKTMEQRVADAPDGQVVGTQIRFLERDRVDIDGVRFLETTLWNDYAPASPPATRSRRR